MNDLCFVRIFAAKMPVNAENKPYIHRINAANMYIHQHKDWPKFTWDNEKLTGLLAEIRHRQGKVLGKMEALGFSIQAEATLENLTLEVLKSSEIEGENLNKQQVRSSIARRLGMEISGLVPSDRNVDGVVEMMLDATQSFSEPLTDERLYGWQAALFPTGRNGFHKITVGAWRTGNNGPMQVVSGVIGREKVHFEAPEASKLSKEMADFLEWFNTENHIDPVLKAAIAHLWFLTIHPFEDGNGRVARAIADMQLARADKTPERFYSMSAQIRIERNDYYTILEKTQKGSLDITEWLEWFLHCLGKSFHKIEGTLEQVNRKSNFWEALAHLDLNNRQRLLLNKLLEGFDGKLNTSKWAKIANCSTDTALRDIQDLIKKEVLVKEEAGGRSTSYVLNEIDNIM
ncbi:Fic family protein [Sediminibacterium salmoneum]|uniref:Fic family protein n=1 Tax=Sediminibacterium salmoneum TaxID=426421 RepID=UPI001FE06308|nr:Fic family protein [Sediminibacterium salmoneum]